MLYSFFYSREIFICVSKEMRNNWLMVSLFIFLFLIAYCAYFLFLLHGDDVFFGLDIDLLVSLILLFGSLFVILSLNTSYLAVTDLNKKKKDILELNEVLKKEKELLKSDEEEIIRRNKDLRLAENKLEKRNKELEAVLNDFYTMRTGLASEMEYKNILKENELIKKRLNEIRHKDI